MLRRPNGDLRHPQATAATASVDVVRQLMIPPPPQPYTRSWQATPNAVAIRMYTGRQFPLRTPLRGLKTASRT